MDIYRGENAIIRTTLLQEDGETALNVEALSYLKVEIINLNKILASYEYGTDEEIRVGATDNEVEVEIPSTVTDKFQVSTKVHQKIYLRVANEEFESEGDLQRDIDQQEIFNVVG